MDFAIKDTLQSQKNNVTKSTILIRYGKNVDKKYMHETADLHTIIPEVDLSDTLKSAMNRTAGQIQRK